MSTTKQSADIIILGAGIAGVSLAASLSANANVILLERESQPGYHATGRSAAYFSPSYGNETVQALSKASAGFYFKPPDNFSPSKLIHPRSALFIGRENQAATLKEMSKQNPSLSRLTGQQACQQVPILQANYVHQALDDPDGGDLDVDAILQGYLGQFRQHHQQNHQQHHQQQNGPALTNHEVVDLNYVNAQWTVKTQQGSYTAPIVVNAAGAWADKIAQLANLDPIGITPMRRTACLVSLPEGIDARDWPLVIDADEQFYFKPDAGLLLISPANESPSEPCDAQPSELDIAIAVERVSQATNLEIRRIEHKWAGLRSFAPDRTFVAGFDPRAKGFFWLAGQGGYGVQSAPALAELCASLMTGSTLQANYENLSSLKEAVSPARLLR